MNRRAMLASASCLLVMPLSATERPAAASVGPIRIWVPLFAEGGVEAVEPLLHSKISTPFQIEYGPLARMNARLEQGELPDVAVLSKSAAQQFAAKGLVTSQLDFVESDNGLAVADNAPAPTLRTTEDFIAFLKATPSIAYFSSGSGALLAKFIENNQLTDIVKPKATVLSEGFTSTLVREGKVASAVQAISELKSGGAKNIVPLPEVLQTHAVMSLVVFSDGPQPQVAADVVRVLTSSQAAAAYADAGLTPVFSH
jgi:hypothetical protein